MVSSGNEVHVGAIGIAMPNGRSSPAEVENSRGIIARVEDRAFWT
jgi:hypothetical protein